MNGSPICWRPGLGFVWVIYTGFGGFWGFLKINLFIYFWLHWVFLAVSRLSLVAVSRGYSSLWCTGFSLWCAGLSLRWLLLLRTTGPRRAGFSSCGMRALERRLSSCGAQAELLRSMWDLPGPGLEPMSPALAGGFPTTAPPGKPIYTGFAINLRVGFLILVCGLYSYGLALPWIQWAAWGIYQAHLT